MALGLKMGFRYEDYYNIDFVSLSNILTASMPKKKKPTQEQIDLIL